LTSIEPHPLLLVTPQKEKSRELALSSVGLDSSLARKTIFTLAKLFESNAGNAIWHSLWEQHCSSYFDLDEADRLLAQYLSPANQRQLFLLQAYCKLLLGAFLETFGLDFRTRPGFFDWLNAIDPHELAAVRQEILSVVKLADIVQDGSAEGLSDFLGFMYQEIFPPALRHLTGEYYTPSWLIRYTLSSLETDANGSAKTVFDPSAGSGGFLAHYIERTSEKGSPLPSKVIAADINPLAIEFCEANLAIAIGKQGAQSKIETVVLLADTIFDPSVEISSGPLFGSTVSYQKVLFGETFVKGEDWSASIKSVCAKYGLAERDEAQFGPALKRLLDDCFSVVGSLNADLIVGNPPWMTWDALRQEYRDKLAVQWAPSTLTTQKGWRAKVAAGKTDLSTLFVYRMVERHAAAHAKLGFVLPLSLFQSRHAGAGFRRFCTARGRNYRLAALNDFSRVKVFGDAANRAAVALFQVDEATIYPAPYIEWANGHDRGQVSGEKRLCQPIDSADASSPIVSFPIGDTSSLTGIGKSQYQARGGVNTGGANTILWLNLFEKNGSLSRVQNVGVTMKARIEIREGWAENEVVHPMVVGLDVTRWRARPSKHLLLFYSPDRPKKAIEEGEVKEKFPNAYKFVNQFKEDLLARKEYHRWGGTGPFYEVYRIGPYTFSPIKVVWQHTGFRGRLRVAVIDDRKKTVTIPDQKVILIPSDNIDEAHYICAFLSSSFVSATLQKYLGTDASTHILDYVGLNHYSSTNEYHARLAALSKEAHEAASAGRPVEEFESQIDSIVETMRA
jgi:methylase of polypeptide subunit release factors